MSVRYLLLVCALLLTALLPVEPPPAEGCAAVWRGSDPPVAIAAESAIIIWDPVEKMQHFIRWAAFEAKSPDFGFLVPTPTQPVLAEVAESVFSTLERWTEPKVVSRAEWNFQPMLCIFGSATLSSRMEPGNAAVQVLHRQTVGGLDAAVLAADDAEALRLWLEKNGYNARPELSGWLAPYLANRWKITAFKIAHDPKTGEAIKTSPVRMSFRTEKPFFPYREPEAPKDSAVNIGRPRLLRVFFVSDQRVQGMVGASPWAARSPWSNSLDENRPSQLMKSLAMEDSKSSTPMRLTVFEDWSSPRAGGDEVYFTPSSDQSNIVPPDRVLRSTIWIPIDIVVIGIIFAIMVTIMIRKGRRGHAVSPAP
jgi:hypothetical protein